jgi:aconitate decarboxylase
MDPALFTGTRWHSPGVTGPYGGATTAARLAGADADLLRRAWGAAGQHSAGTFAAIGSPGVKTTQGRGAMAGVLAAGLAAAGHGGHPDAWTHPDGGLFDAYGAGGTGLLTDGLGERWALLGIALRRWPASSSLQTVIESVLAVRRDEVPRSVEVRLPRASFKLCAGPGWDDQLSALQSARWVTAATWLDGDCWLDQFTDERRGDPSAQSLAEAVTVVEDTSLTEGAAIIDVEHADGTRDRERRDVMPGSPERPLDREAIVGKLTRAAGATAAHALEAALTGTGEFGAVRDLLR